jgi:hypothetical protein
MGERSDTVGAERPDADSAQVIRQGARSVTQSELLLRRLDSKATPRQVQICYPQFSEFLRLKKRHDPAERFQCDWYRHYRTVFAQEVS